MADFSVITQSPTIRAIVQDNLLERAFHDALFPKLLFRGEATPVFWPGQAGDVQLFSAPGLIPIDASPLVPGAEPTPVTYSVEQWRAQLQLYAGTIDTDMPTSIVAIADLFIRNAQQMGLMGAQTINRAVRNRLYNAGLSGWTVSDGVQAAVTTLRVKRLNGFTTARNPALPGASAVQFAPVSSVNPLAVLILDSGGPTEVARNVIGFTADIAGDETGPGTLTLSGGAVSVASGTYVVSVDRTFIVRSGGGMSSRDLTPGTDLATLANVRSVVANFWQDTVPEHPDGRFHAHVGPTALGQLFTDNEFQRLLTSLPDYYMYKSFAIGELLNTAFYRNSECPVVSTVVGGNLNVYDVRDPFAGELTVTGLAGGGQINRMLFTAQGCVSEYYADLNSLITEAGVTGRVGEASISNNGIEVNSERIQMVIRAPLDRLQQKVSTSWKLIADWPIRTDAATGSAARIKRVCVLESAT